MLHKSDESNRYHDEQDGGLGVVGYEVNFDRYFYDYEEPRPVDEIDGDIRELVGDIMDLFESVAGGQ
ncbi:hypothetical protein EXE46_15570 [Halorubrum sp. GN11_10-6_MGM]|uniref:hypothetical protein n=1 Tax=Halorubrum sp. GN11_10-6_MGM TaxID=2518112 RepID=UPI0010F49475|nr:hypothetical protein [Halorubrum sp. GN11_10-6_MGM]TKX72631.1 hypothetical protein EXE46_15570 [Halorubrum sp. GN11_10-6_MGM]